MENILDEIEKIGIVPVIVIDDEKDAVPLAKALCEGGLPAAEVTFRTAAAKASIAAMRKACPDMVVGAGTVLTVAQADEALEAGAQFIVSPGFDEAVVKHCIEKNVPVLPGCATPSEVGRAVALGLKKVKFFPAEQAGGLAMIKAMAAPFVGVRFMPTGGLNAKNIGAYLEANEIIACGGSFMVKKDLIAKGDFESIRRMTEEAVQIMTTMTFVSCDNGVSTFSVKCPERAVYHMGRKGMDFDEKSAVYKADKLMSIVSADGRIKLVRTGA